MMPLDSDRRAFLAAVYAMLDGFVTFPHGPLVAQIAAKRHIRSVFGFRQSVEAGTLGLTIPPSLLQRADQGIE